MLVGHADADCTILGWWGCSAVRTPPPESLLRPSPHPQITSTSDCDPTQQPECCKPSTKPAFLQFKLPVSQAMVEQGSDRRYVALTKLARCRLSYARTTTGSTSSKRMSWKFTNQAKGRETPGTEPDDARYASIPLNFGSNREVSICLYTFDIQKDLDCSWENLWWVRWRVCSCYQGCGLGHRCALSS